MWAAGDPARLIAFTRRTARATTESPTGPEEDSRAAPNRPGARRERLRRTYHVEVPANPLRSTLPVIVVFHGGGHDAETIAARGGVDPPNPVSADVENYLLVFPELDPLLSERPAPSSSSGAGTRVSRERPSWVRSLARCGFRVFGNCESAGRW